MTQLGEDLIPQIPRDPGTLDRISGPEFRTVVAELLSSQGHEVQWLPGSRDTEYPMAAIRRVGTSSGMVLLCKNSPGRQVTVADVRTLSERVRNTTFREALIVTNTLFTQRAKALMSESQFPLSGWDRSAIQEQLAAWGNWHIERIHLSNIRRFRQLDLSLRADADAKGQPRMRTLVIGKNGTCKSTLLRCIALGLAPKREIEGMLGESLGGLVGNPEALGIIEIDLRVSGTAIALRARTQIQSRGGRTNLESRDLTCDALGAPEAVLEAGFVVGYGAGRSTTGSAEPRYSVASATRGLLDYDQHLIDPELAIRRLRDFLGEKRYPRTMKGIRRALGLSREDVLTVGKGGGVVVKSKRLGTVPREGLADGHRLPLNMIIDIYSWGLQANRVTDSGDLHGMLLIDEIDQHLHPTLQIDVVNRISKLFPRLQLFATTHSPLSALGVRPEELVVLKERGKYVDVVRDVPDFSRYSAEDVLVDERMFDTSAHSPEISRKLQRYRRLASVPKSERSKLQSKQLQALAAELRTLPIPETVPDPLDALIKRLADKFQL